MCTPLDARTGAASLLAVDRSACCLSQRELTSSLAHLQINVSTEMGLPLFKNQWLKDEQKPIYLLVLNSYRNSGLCVAIVSLPSTVQEMHPAVMESALYSDSPWGT